MLFNLISYRDILDLSKILKKHGWKFILNKLKFKSSHRIKEQWDHYEPTGSNWWDIPKVRRRWNLKISGSEYISWEEYVEKIYIRNRSDLCMLSIGCGTGEKERYFAANPSFRTIEGIDISENAIAKATNSALSNNLINIRYYACDFKKNTFNKESYDFILFNSSLHHFREIEQLLTEKIIPILKPDGMVIVFEYTGPNRFQYTRAQIEDANKCLKLIPEHLKLRIDKTLKKRNYSPGWLRMWLNDPSEAPYSEEILPVLRKCLLPMEEKPIGGALLHMLFKDIAHNFIKETPEVKQTLNTLFKKEDEYFLKTGGSDFWFGVYGKKRIANNKL